MGNCPSGYVLSSGGIKCVVKCPSESGFDNRTIGGEDFCVYRNRPEVKVLLKQVGAWTPTGPNEKPPATIEDLLPKYPSWHQAYKEAKDDFDKKMPVVLSQISKENQIADAFKELQTAENVRDQSPQAYQDARNRYYTLLNGEEWINQESQRIAGAEVTPKINQYTQMKTDLTTRLNQQQQTIEVVNAVKDKVLSMKDDFAYTTNTFAKQISDLKNQIQIERKKTEIQKVEVFSWIDMLLNIALTVLMLGLVVVIIRKVLKQRQQTPAYTSPSRY